MIFFLTFLIKNGVSILYEYCLYPSTNSSGCSTFNGDKFAFNNISGIPNFYYANQVDTIFYIDGTNGVLSSEDQNFGGEESEKTLINKLFHRAFNDGGKSPKNLTFKSLNSRQRLAFSDPYYDLYYSNYYVNTFFIDLDFTLDNAQYYHFTNLTLINCRFTRGASSAYELEGGYIVTDISSMKNINIFNLQNFYQNPHFILLDLPDSSSITSSTIPIVSNQAYNSIYINNINLFSSITWTEQGSTAPDLKLISSKITLTLGAANFLDTSYHFYFKGSSITFTFVPGTIYSLDRFPIVNFYPGADNSNINIRGSWNKWSDPSFFSNVSIKAQNYHCKLIINDVNTNNFPFRLIHVNKNFTLSTSLTTLNLLNGFETSASKENFLVFDIYSEGSYTVNINKYYKITEKVFTSIAFTQAAMNKITLNIEIFDFSSSWGSTYLNDFFPVYFPMHFNPTPYFPSITLTKYVYPDPVNISIIVDPVVTANNLVSASTRSCANLIFFKISNISSPLKNAKIVLPPTPNQHGFWFHSSIASGLVNTNGGNLEFKVTFDANKRIHIPLYLCIASSSFSSFCDSKSYILSPENNLFNISFMNINSYIPIGIYDFILQLEYSSYNGFPLLNFSLLDSSFRSNLSILIKSNQSIELYQPPLYFIQNQLFTKPITISNIKFDTPVGVNSWELDGKLNIKNCTFKDLAAIAVSYKSSSEINIEMTQTAFVSYSKARKSIGGADFTNVDFTVLDFSSLSQISYLASVSNQPKIEITSTLDAEKLLMICNSTKKPYFIITKNYTSSQPLIFYSTVNSTSYVSGLKLKTEGYISVLGDWTNLSFTSSIYFLNNDLIRIYLSNPSLPYFETSSSLNYELDTTYTSTSRIIKNLTFPDSFINTKISASSGLYRHNSGIIILPSSNSIVIDDLYIPESANVTFNSLEIKNKLILSTGSSLLKTTDVSQLGKITFTGGSLDIYWNTEDGFPKLQLSNPSNEFNLPNLSIIYDSTFNFLKPTASSYNKIFNVSIPGATNQYGALLIEGINQQCSTFASNVNLNISDYTDGIIKSNNIIFSLWCQNIEGDNSKQNLYLQSSSRFLPLATPYPQETPYPTMPAENTIFALGSLIGITFGIVICFTVYMNKKIKSRSSSGS